MKSDRNPRIDAYIAAAAPFARPILNHLRELVHRGCPEVTESIKWSAPFFEYKGLLANMAAFKAHCSFGFWHPGMRARADGAKADEAMGQFGRIARLSDLPSDAKVVALVRAAAKLNESGAPRRAAPKVPRAEAAVPAPLAAALRSSPAAAATFADLSPSGRRDYCEWIAEAKREETRQSRVATAIAWLAEGKSRNWKYERC